MKTTGLFRVHSYRVRLTRLGEPLFLLPFGDVHYGAPMHATEEFEDWCAQAKALGDRALYLGMGDYQDLLSTSERKQLKGGLHESTLDTLETLYRGLIDQFAERLSFMRGRLLGLIEGNHYTEFSTGETSTMLLARALKTTYLGVCSLIRLAVEVNGSKTALDLYAHHGVGGSARLVGGSLNAVQYRAEGIEADIYLMGHDHRRSVGTASRLLLQSNRRSGGLEVKSRKVIFARTGSFLRGYVDGAVSYVADGARNPADLGGVTIEITPRRTESRGMHLDLRGIT